MLAAQGLTGDGVRAVEGELHVMLRGDAKDGLDVPHKLRVAIGAALHAHVVHLPACQALAQALRAAAPHDSARAVAVHAQ